MSLITAKLNFPYQKKILVTLESKTTFESMFFGMKINQPFQFRFQIEHLKIQWISCL